MNIQNIPRDDKVIKAAFGPKLDALLAFDFPNIEAKLLAFYLQSIGHPSMAEAFREGLDLHKLTAHKLFATPSVEDVTDEQRQIGKKLNFSIIYGGGVPTLTKQLGCTAPRALDLLRGYHKAWPGIGWATRNRDADPGTLAWWVQQRVKERGYITTLWGRHLHPESMHKALNALCQGCAADLMKWSLIRVHRYCVEHSLRSHLINTVHDELMLDATKDEVPLLVRVIPELMTFEAVQLVVPIRPEPDISYTTWADKAPYQEAA